MPYESGKLTPEEIEPSEEDLLLGTLLVQQGWKSTSNKYRIVVRWATIHIPLKELIKPAMLETPEAQWYLANAQRPWLRMPPKGLPVEELTLTVRQFRAFKLAGGQSA